VTKRVAFHTLGCKLNYAETSTIGRAFSARGFEVVDFTEVSDVVLVNTCSVTENADREARKLVRQALRRSPGAYVIVVGCYAQLRPEQIASIEGVDLVLGTREKFRLFDHVGTFDKGAYARVVVGDIGEADDFGPAFAADAGDRTRSFLKVQDGCDYTCSFCTIPLARGASRSQDIDATVAQASDIVARGFKEIVLSGVNVGDYGATSGRSFVELLRALVDVRGDFRIRISSIEPNLLTDDIIRLAVDSEKLCPHFHIPLQSGSGEVLKRMRRRYNTGLYTDRIETVRRLLPDCGIGIDVIVGFPGETDALFDETYRYLVDLPFSYLHVFSYSERPETHALSLDGSVPHPERARRSSMLRILSEKKRAAFSRASLGQTRRVLFETGGEQEFSTGFTDNYIRVGLPRDAALDNTFQNVVLTGVDGALVRGSCAVSA
jgi:threonylcarbamoyladenosine tRNA methylthiotransferase MtaB